MYNEEYRGIPEEYTPISAKQYIIMQLIFMIPIVGLLYMVKLVIMEENKNKKNFALSYLVVIVALVLIFFIFKDSIFEVIKEKI